MENEVCICAAIRDSTGTIWRGHRHADAIHTAIIGGGTIPLTGGRDQGFITSRNRFVTREEGYKLQIEAGIPSATGEYMGERLYSEDLY